jgi:hypothetical protein
MAQITINIPNQHRTRVLDAVKNMFPIPQIPNPDFDPNDPLEIDPVLIPEYTDANWVKKILEDYLRDLVKRQEQIEAMDIAKRNVNIPDEIIGD